MVPFPPRSVLTDASSRPGREQPIRHRAVEDRHRRIRPHDLDRTPRSGVRAGMATGWARHRVRRRQRQNGPDLERGDGRTRRSNPDRPDHEGRGAVLQPGRASPRFPRPRLRHLALGYFAEPAPGDCAARRGKLCGHRWIQRRRAPVDHCGADAHIRRPRCCEQTGNVFDISSDFTSSAVRVWDTDTGEPAGPPIIGRGGDPMDFMERTRSIADLRRRDQPGWPTCSGQHWQGAALA